MPIKIQSIITALLLFDSQGGGTSTEHKYTWSIKKYEVAIVEIKRYIRRQSWGYQTSSKYCDSETDKATERNKILQLHRQTYYSTHLNLPHQNGETHDIEDKMLPPSTTTLGDHDKN